MLNKIAPDHVDPGKFGTESGLTAHTVQHAVHPCPVGQCITFQKRRIEEMVFCLCIGHKPFEITAINIAAGQWNTGSPGSGAAPRQFHDLVCRLLSQLSIGSDFSAQHRQGRCAAGCLLYVQPIVSRHFLGITLAIKQRPDAGI